MNKEPINVSISEESDIVFEETILEDTTKVTAAASIMWEPEHGLNHISDDALFKALILLDNGLIKDVKIEQDDKGEYKAKISYYFSACIYGQYNDSGAINKTSDIKNITQGIKAPIGTCSNNCCGEIRCIPVLAGYIKYAEENGIYNALMKERELHRSNNDNKNENLLFEWNPEDKEKFNRLPGYMYQLAETLINHGYIAFRPYPNEKGKIQLDFKKMGQCCDKNKDGKMFGNKCAGAHDIIRAFHFEEMSKGDTKNGIAFGKNFGCTGKISTCQCEAPMCPYMVAAYMLYLRLTGQENQIKYAKRYSLEHPDEIYYGDDQFKFNVNEDDVKKIKQSIASAPSDVLDEALRLLDSGEAFLCLTLDHSNNEKDTRLYYRINTSRKMLEGNTAAECVNTSYGKDIFHSGPVGLTDYEGIAIKDRLIRLIGCIDYCRRCGIDISDALSRREYDAIKLQDLAKSVDGLERLVSFIESDKTSSLACIMQGDTGSGKESAIKYIADILCQKGKITTSKYIKLTMEQLGSWVTFNGTRKDKPLPPPGTNYVELEQNQLYVITGLDEYLLKGTAKAEIESKNRADAGKRHLSKVLGSFKENTYVIIVSLSQKATEGFLDLNKKYNYTYGQNVVVFNNKTAEELYEEYYNALSDTIQYQIVDKEKHKKEFAEFIALNEKFLPFTNSALAHYLSEYSNVEAAPVLPPNIYKKEEMANELADIIGMDAVKKQLAEFESYITFQKKATASGIKIKQGNLHMQFLGNPGTGKTTIARIVAKMLYDIGVLEENKVIEVERKDLIGEYTGQTAPKTAQKIKEAMGGVLFIDEAYSLYFGSQDTFGKEAVATLIKAMEDYKEDFIVIFAGYDKEMQDFLKANSGIESRIGYTFHFEDYTASELTEMFKRSLIKQGFEIGDGVLKKASDICSYYRRRKNFGNGRFVKKLEQRAIINHANNAETDGWEIVKISINDIPEINDMGTQSSGGSNNDITLDQIIGMNSVKDQIKKFQTKIRFEQKAKAAGAKIKRGSSHMLFLGNPGTGKTTIARIITKELYEAGVILENKLIEVERKDLVGEFIGQTAPKTADAIERAIGGVLFIDEAYSLVQGYKNDLGYEAVATLIKAMEDRKDEFVVIFAGYEREMNEFLDTNSGIASRIGYTFTFEDYTADELADIFKLKMDLNYLSYTDEAIDAVKKVMQYFVSVPNFGNGRFADRVVNVAIELHSERLAENDEITDDLLRITKEDIPTVKYMLDHMPDGKKMINPENVKDSQNERTAVHELGHALIIKLLIPQNSIERITISAEGSGALGYVRHSIDNDIRNYTKTDLEADICVSMAGIASEEVFLGEYGNGGTSDLEKATNIAKNMIMRFGMSKHGFANKKELGDEEWQEINDILKEQFDRAKETIGQYKDGMEKAKKYLLTNHTISDEEFTKIVMPN